MGKGWFQFPKNTDVLSELIELTTKSEDIVLDFFAGSGSTAHAVMKVNAVHQSKRRFMIVQLPEPTGKEPYKTIAEITKERLRRAAAKIKAENPLFAGDLGFRVFKLDSSNIRAWEPDRDKLAESLFDSTEHLKADRSENDVLFELLLKLGLDLTVPIDTRAIAGKTVHSIGAGVLLVCLTDKITTAEVEALALGIAAWHQEQSPAGEAQVVFRDSAFENDVAKTNCAAILSQHGLSNVRSL